MPNHVINEIVFENVNWFQKRKILKKVFKDNRVDFEILVPAPINIWNGNVGKNHEETFPDNHLNTTYIYSSSSSNFSTPQSNLWAYFV